jgi:tRNA 5-methylaminomethyl-2-thiouridine biosynthesis bifunctional protein
MPITTTIEITKQINFIPLRILLLLRGVIITEKYIKVITMKSTRAQVYFNDQGTPMADAFGDVYFSNESGIDETRHVFIAGNDLQQRWLSHSRDTFIIAETGFGTGLNCLVVMLEFAAFIEENPNLPLKHLHILTTELYPLQQNDIATTLNVFPELADITQALLRQYPIDLQGCHRLSFTPWHCSLDLWIGDVHTVLPQWQTPKSGLVDAWFLDGFAPSKNPDMWNETLFNQMARLTRQQGTFATFTAAGVVKRGLKAAGFNIAKRKGFGPKRDMLTGYLPQQLDHIHQHPWYYNYPSQALSKSQGVAIIGGGLAGACLALALAKRHIKVTLYCQGDALADGASGNPQGGFYPQLHSQASQGALIQAYSFLYARRVYDNLLQEGYTFAHDFCGVLQLTFNDKVASRQQAMVDRGVWPRSLIYPLDANQTSEYAGLPLPYGSMCIPQGGWLNPKELIKAMCQAAAATGNLTIKLGMTAKVFSVQEHEVLVGADKQSATTYQHAIFACGHQSIELPELKHLPLRPVRGQVEAVTTQAPLDKLKTVLCHKGYLAPVWQGHHALGSTYIKEDTDTQIRASESAMNLATHSQALSLCDWAQNLHHDNKARAAIRLGIADHQPLVGAIPDQDRLFEHYGKMYKGKFYHSTHLNESHSPLSVLTGLGSRGLTTAPLMAEILASQLCHEPQPLPLDLLNAINPARFSIRQCQRGGADDIAEI